MAGRGGGIGRRLLDRWPGSAAVAAHRRDYRIAAEPPGIADYAAVVAEALGSPDQARLRVVDGVTTVDPPGPCAQEFAEALDELLSAPADPRYVVARPVLPRTGEASWASPDERRREDWHLASCAMRFPQFSVSAPKR